MRLSMRFSCPTCDTNLIFSTMGTYFRQFLDLIVSNSAQIVSNSAQIVSNSAQIVSNSV